MITQVLPCPYCQGIDIVRHGTSSEGKQRYRCRECREERGRTFLLDYSYAGQSPDIKQQIIDMAMNASGIRDTARVLHISSTTVIKEFKKKNLSVMIGSFNTNEFNNWLSNFDICCIKPFWAFLNIKGYFVPFSYFIS